MNCTPFLLFDGECADAMAAHLVNGDLDISATDWLHPTRVPRPGNTVAVYVRADDLNELRVAFDGLAVGADETLLDDPRDMPFGTYGHLADRYGVHWFFRGPPPGRADLSRGGDGD